MVVSEDVKEFFSVDKFFIRAALCKDEKCTHKLRRWVPCRKHSEVTTEEAYQWCETKGGAGYGNDVWENHNHSHRHGRAPRLPSPPTGYLAKRRVIFFADNC